MDFIVDTEGDPNIELQNEVSSEEETPEEVFSFDPFPIYPFLKPSGRLSPASIVKQIAFELDNNVWQTKQIEEPPKPKEKSELDIAFEEAFQLLDNISMKDKRTTPAKSNVNKSKAEALLKKSVITPEFEQMHSVPPYKQSEKKLKELRKKEREKTKGKKWFDLPATEVTDEIKRDLEVLQMRSVLDPKHFYKKNDLKVLPKYFQVGKVMDSPIDYHNNRLTKKERKNTLVDELMANDEFNKYNKRKYKEIVEEQSKTHYKAYQQAKKLKRKKKN